MPIRMSPERLARVRAARDCLLQIVRKQGQQAGRGWVSADAAGFSIMHRTPFTRLMPEGRQSRAYAEALVKQKAVPDLPYTMEVWYLSQKVLNVQWDENDKIQLISFRPGEWETKLPVI
jgi:hypothetical protein